MAGGLKLRVGFRVWGLGFRVEGEVCVLGFILGLAAVL